MADDNGDDSGESDGDEGLEVQEVQSGLRYGILGGTFYPPHIGHLILAQEVYTRLALDRVWFMPAGTPPHKAGRVISPAEQRRAMVELAIDGDERFGLCTVELERTGPSYTVDTLRTLRQQWGSNNWLCLILGWDMLVYLPNWRDPNGVLEQVDHIAAVHRPGYAADPEELAQLARQLPDLQRKVTIFPMPQLDIAATDLRARVAAGRPIRYFVPDAVRDYIERHQLYLVSQESQESQGQRQ